MSTTFLGGNTLTSDDVVIFNHLRIWAERGLIHIEDARDNSYEVVSVRTMLHRMRGISDMLGNSTSREKNTESQFDQAWRKDNQEMLECMTRVIRRAQEQGMPSDAAASRDLARRAKKTIHIPNALSAM